jgi:predicted helicase
LGKDPQAEVAAENTVDFQPMSQSGTLNHAQSWAHFRSLVADLPTTKAKGDAFESLCLAFLRADPRYAAELESVWLLKQVPKAVASRLNLPESDEGIDGIARTRSGEWWASH